MSESISEKKRRIRRSIKWTRDERRELLAEQRSYKRELIRLKEYEQELKHET